MKQNRETEYKCLVSAEQFSAIKAHFNPKITVIQTNHYFDTPDEALKALNISCRIRQYADTAELTFKRKNGVANDEYTFDDVDPSTIFMDPHVRSLLAQWGVIHPLTAIGVLKTERSLVKLTHGDLCLDVNVYHGITDYELEYEVTGDEITGLAEFQEILGLFNLKWVKNAPAKVKRCVQAARASRLESIGPHIR
jgi:uncharacterized protein YjbK